MSSYNRSIHIDFQQKTMCCVRESGELGVGEVRGHTDKTTALHLVFLFIF